MSKLEAEREALKAENAALRSAADARPAPPAQPQIVFQEMKLTEELKERADTIAAERTAARVVDLLKSDGGADAGATKSLLSGALLDPSREAALSPGTTLEAAQKRVVELLEELDARTRLEGRTRVARHVSKTR